MISTLSINRIWFKSHQNQDSQQYKDVMNGMVHLNTIWLEIFGPKTQNDTHTQRLGKGRRKEDKK